MLGLALLILINAVIVAVFGSGGMATRAASFVQILFCIYLVMFLVSHVVDLRPGDRWPHEGPGAQKGEQT